MRYWLSCFAVILASLTLEAKVFRNAYVAFEIPDTWKCVLEHTEWVCRSVSDKDSKEAIIILTAKEVGPTDSFEAYTQHLSTPQTSTARQGVAGSASRVVYPPKQVKINDQVWIDGLHMGSEVQNYFTRYLATIKDRVSVLVTLSAHKNYYTKYSPDFFKTVMSLRVVNTKNLLAKPETGPIRPGSGVIGQPISGAMPVDMVGTENPPGVGGNGGKTSTRTLFLIIAIILAAIAAYVLVKMKK